MRLLVWKREKKADFVVVGVPLSATASAEAQITERGIDPVSVLVHSCTAADVEMVVVDGQLIVENGELLTKEEEQIMNQARQAIGGTRARAGVKAKA